MEEKLLLARYAHSRLRELDGVEVGPPPDLSVVTFRAIPSQGDPDEYNMRLVGALLEDGRVSLSPTTVKGTRWVRLAILAPRTHRDAIDLAIEVIREKLRLLGRE